jgi:hypothetical protein
VTELGKNKIKKIEKDKMATQQKQNLITQDYFKILALKGLCAQLTLEFLLK